MRISVLVCECVMWLLDVYSKTIRLRYFEHCIQHLLGGRHNLLDFQAAIVDFGVIEIIKVIRLFSEVFFSTLSTSNQVPFFS